MARTLSVYVLVASLGVALVAQQSKLQFDVASVKRNESGRVSGSPLPRVHPGGRFTASLTTVEALLSFAYDLKSYRIVGGPDWVRKDWFEINARAEHDAPVDEVRLMVRSLLEDRFSLVTHIEQRTMPVLALVRARPEAFALGPDLISIDECSPRAVNELRRRFPDKYPTPAGGGVTSSCSSKGLGSLADFLTVVENIPVIDATGLTGSFYYTVRSRVSLVSAFLGVTHTDPDLPSLSTALNDQLGLKLESRRVALDVIVIDSVREPTED